MSEFLLEAKNLKKHFPLKKGFFKREVGQVKAVDDITLSIRRGETLGLVGESGCGKSTLGRTLIRLYEPTSGEIKMNGKDFLKLKKEDLRQQRKNIQMIFQDPYASLDPRMTVAQILEEPFTIHKISDRQLIQNKTKDLLEMVGLDASQIDRYPHEFSGGQRQRICIARAIALSPELIICDEPVSALDVSIQAQILNLLSDLQKQLNLTYLFISHDLSVIEHFCDRVAVMYLGRIVEFSSREDLFKNPQHPYTQALLKSIPRFGTAKTSVHRALSGDVPSPLSPPTGCYFHPRCPQKMDICSEKSPALRGDTHQTACWLTEKN